MRQRYTIARISEAIAAANGSSLWRNIEPIKINQYQWVNDYTPRVEIRLFYTEVKLHLLFRTYEKNPLIRYRHMNEPVYTDSCVEFFVQPDPTLDARYLNFEFNAAGTLLLEIGAHRFDRQYFDNINPNIFQIRAATNIVDEISDEVYWELEYSIPFDFVQAQIPSFNPTSGTAFRANFYKCGEHPSQHFGSWNALSSEAPDFHRSIDFGELVLE